MPNAAITEKRMYADMESSLETHGHKPARFPSLIPEHYFAKEAEHIENFAPNVFWVTKGGTDDELEEKLAMRPTSETAMYDTYSQWIRSHRDLPLKIYQSCQVWRYETKHTRPFLRDREFHWIEAHDVFATAEEAWNQVKEDMEMTYDVLRDKWGLPIIFFHRPDWDKFAGGQHSFAADALMPDKKVLQLPSTHFYGQNFAKSYNIKFLDENEKEKYAFQTTFGPAISRIYAALISVHGDNKGLRLPFGLAPTQVVIVPILKADADSTTLLQECYDLQTQLRELDYRTEVDDSDKRPGSKYYYWEARGTPLRIEIGSKELEKHELTIARRDNGKKETIKQKDLETYIEKAVPEILKTLKDQTMKWFEGNTHEATDFEELGKQLEKGGFVKVNFCSREKDGLKCADKIGEAYHAEVRGTKFIEFGKEERVANGAKCIGCGKEAKHVMYVAKAY